MMSKVYDFLKENEMLPECFDDKAIEKDFLRDIKEKDTVSMIQTFQRSTDSELPDESILAIDAGGTNLRFSEYRGGAFSEPVVMPMFGIKEEITADKFFDLMAYEISKYDAKDIGFCFSYPCEILDNKDGRIILFAKEVKIKNAKGKIIGEERTPAVRSIGNGAECGASRRCDRHECFDAFHAGMLPNAALLRNTRRFRVRHFPGHLG